MSNIQHSTPNIHRISLEIGYSLLAIGYSTLKVTPSFIPAPRGGALTYNFIGIALLPYCVIALFFGCSAHRDGSPYPLRTGICLIRRR